VVPLVVMVQFPPAVAIQLSPSVLPVRVAVTFPLVGVLGEYVRVPQVGAVVSGGT
jgi:hypothetical protein